MKNIAIIPARGGSKRIPRKNIKSFMGKPIIAYSIETALSSGLFDEIMVSTDDKEIAEVAVQYGAKIPFFRSVQTANDYATLADVLHEVLERYMEFGCYFDNMCCLLATSPLIDEKLVAEGYEKLLKNEDWSTVAPVVAFSYPILRSLQKDENGIITMRWPEYRTARSQDLETFYHDSGTFYWHRIPLWSKGINKRGAIILDELHVQDIDTEMDWKLAELKYTVLHGKKK